MTSASGRAIDADGHIRDDDTLLRKYLAAPYNDRVFLGTGAPRDGWDNSMGGTLGTRAVDANVWLEALEAGGLEQEILQACGGTDIDRAVQSAV